MNRKRNGFTLVELLAVIALLAIIATLAVTSAINVSVKLKDDMYCEKLEFISSAAKQYGTDMIDSLTEAGIQVTVADLVTSGKLRYDQNTPGSYILDPRDNSSMDHITMRIYLKNKRAYVHLNVDESFCAS